MGAVSSLSAYGGSDESIRLTAPLTSGTYYYGACVDPVPGESDTGNNCSRAVPVHVFVSSGLGFAPADEAAFHRLVVGKRMLSDDDFVSQGRFSQGSSVIVISGSYGYENTGPNMGILTFADLVSFCLLFDSRTTGIMFVETCDAESKWLSWRLVEIPSG